MKNQKLDNNKNRQQIILIVAIILVAFNLRPAITSVGPLLGIIRDDLGLSNWSAGLITSLPLLAFAIMSPFAASLGNRFGNMHTMLAGLIILSMGIGFRLVSTSFALFFGTGVIGIGIAIMNVLLPAIIKDKFPNKVGLMTSTYTTAMVIFAAIGSGLSVPLSKGAGLGWRLTLAFWLLLGILGAFIWLFALLKETDSYRTQLQSISAPESKLWSSPLAWQITIFMGLQSFTFYTMISWLPEILQNFGFSLSYAGWLLFYAQFISLTATFAIPILAEGFNSQQWIAVLSGGLYTLGFTGLLFGGSPSVLIFWVTLIGLGSGATVSLAFFFISTRARNVREAGQLSGMAQSIGYLLAAIGPFFIGLLYDLTASWTTPLVTIIIVCLVMTLAGFGAGRDKL